MKIIIEEECELINKTGIGRYTEMLFAAFKNTGIEYENYPKTFMRYFVKNPYLRVIMYSLWYNIIFTFKLFLRKEKLLLIASNFYLPVLKLKNVIYVPVIHDLRLFIYPDTAGRLGGSVFRLRTKNALRNADYIITVSNTVKQEIVKLFNFPEEKIFTVYNAAAEIKNNDTDIKKYGIEKNKYIFSVSSLNRHKNIKSLIEAFELISPDYPDIKLVLAGKRGNDTFKNCTSNIIFTGYIGDNELYSLYSNALLYCSPSLYEGFGIPNIEAQSLGAPILCSDIPVYRETMQDSAEFSAPDALSIAEKLKYLINNPQRLKELSTKGYENIKRFDMHKVTEQLNGILTVLK